MVQGLNNRRNTIIDRIGIGCVTASAAGFIGSGTLLISNKILDGLDFEQNISNILGDKWKLITLGAFTAFGFTAGFSLARLFMANANNTNTNTNTNNQDPDIELQAHRPNNT